VHRVTRAPGDSDRVSAPMLLRPRPGRPLQACRLLQGGRGEGDPRGIRMLDGVPLIELHDELVRALAPK